MIIVTNTFLKETSHFTAVNNFFFASGPFCHPLTVRGKIWCSYKNRLQTLQFGPRCSGDLLWTVYRALIFITESPLVPIQYLLENWKFGTYQMFKRVNSIIIILDYRMGCTVTVDGLTIAWWCGWWRVRGVDGRRNLAACVCEFAGVIKNGNMFVWTVVGGASSQRGVPTFSQLGWSPHFWLCEWCN